MQIFILAEGLKVSFLALSDRESSLLQTFCESCVHLDINHPSVHMTWRFVIQGCPTLIEVLNVQYTERWSDCIKTVELTKQQQ